MDHRRIHQPAGSNFQNSVPANNLQPNLSFGSTESNNSNESFRTQVPLPYYTSQGQDQAFSNFAGNNSAYAQFGTQQRSTGSNGSQLDPTSTPYVPQGDTPIILSAGPGQGWGAPYSGGQNGQGLSHQGQNMGGMQNQYQNDSQYQQSQIQMRGQISGMIPPQGQGPYGNNSYGQYGAIGAAAPQNNYNQHSNGQMGYGNSAAPARNYSLPYGRGQMSNYHQVNDANSSFQTQYSEQMPGRSSIDSNSTIYSSRSSNMSSKMNKQQSRPDSVQSHRSRDQKKFVPPRNDNGYRGSQRASNSSTPAIGGFVTLPQQSQVIESTLSRAHTPEPFKRQHRKGKSLAFIDTSSIPALVAKAVLVTPQTQLRSRRGQTVSSTNDTVRKSVSSWVADIPDTSSNASTSENMQRRGSPVKGMGGLNNSMAMMSVKPADPFTSPSAAMVGGPFDCMTDGGPFNGNFPLNGPFSNELMKLTEGGQVNPRVDVALNPNNVPFVEFCRASQSDNWGVIKIKNIPYSVNRAEVLAFLGRNARIVNESESEPIHIIMERVTSKTLDCYVEFINFGEAVSAVQRFESNRMDGRGGRLGQRHVDVELSTQDELMHELFPKAKNVRWVHGRAEIISAEDDPWSSGFDAFVTSEELVMMTKHVETPQRSPFSKDCPQRPFECLVSTLAKYPWYMVDRITIDDRQRLHKTTVQLLELLVDRINHNDEMNVNMSQMLLKRVWRAALRCPGFTPAMKDDIIFVTNLSPQLAIENGLAPHASYWNKLWCIGPKPGAPVDVLLWYIGKIRQACYSHVQLSLAEQAEKGAEVQELKLFGDLNKHINYGPNLGSKTLAEVAKIEWAAIEKALRIAFTPALPSSR